MNHFGSPFAGVEAIPTPEDKELYSELLAPPEAAPEPAPYERRAATEEELQVWESWEVMVGRYHRGNQLHGVLDNPLFGSVIFQL